MGGLKRKISTDEKIEKKESKSVAFSKRRSGLYSKASQLCVLSGAQVAILATPPCSKSNVSFYSFGHSSVDSVVSAFLKNQCPREDPLGRSEYWWEDERLAESEDPNELSDAVDSISRMLQNLKGTLRSKALANREDTKKIKKMEVVDQSQTLNLQSACASTSCIHEDPPENHQGLVKNFKEEDQIAEDNRDVVIQETHQEPDGNQTLGFQPSFASLCIQDVSPENVEVSVNNSEQKDQTVASSDTSNNNDGLLENLDGFDQVLTLDDDDFTDFEMNSEGFITTKLEMDNVSTSPSCTGPEGAEDGAMVVVHSNSKKDNQMVAVSDSNNALPGDVYGCNQEFDIDQIFDLVTSTDELSMNSEMIDDVSMMMYTDKNQNWCSNSEAVERGAVALHRDLEQDNVSTSRSCTGSEGAEDVAMVVVHSNSKKDNPMVAVSDSNNALPGEVYGCNQEFDIDQIFDLVTSTEDLSRNSEKMDDVSMMMNKSKNQNRCSDSEAAEHGAVALHRDLEQDNLHFSDFFNGLFHQDNMTM